MKKITFTLILSFLLNALTAQITVQGTVSDDVSYLPGANILIKNSTIGTTSDFDGNFTLEVKNGDTLAISYIGFKTQEIIIDDHQKPINVTLLQNETLDEVIVTSQSIRRVTCTTRCYWGIETEEVSEEIPEDSSYSFPTPSLYPNPSSNGIFHLKMPSSYQQVEVSITNLLGQQVYTHTYQNTSASISLDIGAVKTGIYLINTIADGQRLPTQKAIRK